MADSNEDRRLKECARALAERVEASLDAIVEHHAAELGIDKKWVISEIVYQATQRAREIAAERISSVSHGRSS